MLIMQYPCVGDGLHLVIHGLGDAELRVTAGLAHSRFHKCSPLWFAHVGECIANEGNSIGF